MLAAPLPALIFPERKSKRKGVVCTTLPFADTGVEKSRFYDIEREKKRRQ
jgi:hypothetical protein